MSTRNASLQEAPAETRQTEGVTASLPTSVELDGEAEPAGDANGGATEKKRKRRTKEEISLGGLIPNKKKRQDKRESLNQHIERKLVELSRLCGDDFFLVTVNDTTLKIKTSKALSGIASTSWLDIEQSVPAYLVQAATQERVARLTGRFKDQTFIDLDRSVQIKTMETFLDTSVKNRKGVLPYATTTSIEAVVKLAPWWPAEVTYAPPRKMVQDDLNTVFAALVRHAEATDDMLMRKLEASVGTLGVDMVVQLAIMASMKGLMSKEADMQRTTTNSGAESSGTIEKDGKVYLDPVQTTATALRRCQEEHLPDEEHSKKYVRKGSVSMCKTAVLLHQMYNAVAAAGGLKELKKAAKRKRLRLALGISKKDYNSAQLKATYKKYLTPLMVPATEGEMVVGASLAVDQAKAGSGNDGSGSADGAVTEGEANGEPSADNQAEAGSDDSGRSSADGSAVPASAEVEVCPTAHRLTVRQLASGPDPSVHCPQAENTTMVPASRTRAAAAAVSNTAVAAAVSDVHVQAAAGASGSPCRVAGVERRGCSSAAMQAPTPGALAAAIVLSATLPAGDFVPLRKSSRAPKPSAKIMQVNDN